MSGGVKFTSKVPLWARAHCRNYSPRRPGWLGTASTKPRIPFGTRGFNSSSQHDPRSWRGWLGTAWAEPRIYFGTYVFNSYSLHNPRLGSFLTFVSYLITIIRPPLREIGRATAAPRSPESSRRAPRPTSVGSVRKASTERAACSPPCARWEAWQAMAWGSLSTRRSRPRSRAHPDAGASAKAHHAAGACARALPAAGGCSARTRGGRAWWARLLGGDIWRGWAGEPRSQREAGRPRPERGSACGARAWPPCEWRSAA